MGLEQVELILDVEHEFGIKVPDAAAERVKTVADLAALVITLLPKPPCTTAMAFYQFRRLLVDELGIERRRVRPRAKLDELISKKRRQNWNKLIEKNSRLPELVLLPGLQSLVIVFAVAVLMCTFWLSYVVWGNFGTTASVILTAMLVVAAAISIGLLHSRLAGEFPKEFVTVGDVVRCLVPMDAGMEGSGERLIAQQRVLEKVRQIAADIAGEPLEKVRPETEFVKDLGFG